MISPLACHPLSDAISSLYNYYIMFHAGNGAALRPGSLTKFSSRFIDHHPTSTRPVTTVVCSCSGKFVRLPTHHLFKTYALFNHHHPDSHHAEDQRGDAAQLTSHAPILATRRHTLAAVLSAPSLLNASHFIKSSPAFATTIPAPQSSTLRLPTPDELAAVEAAFSATMSKAKAPVMLRLVFHDAGTFRIDDGRGGINSSVQFELERPENKELRRGFNIISATFPKLKGTAAEGTISMADLIALGGARAVKITGGPDIVSAGLLVGRKDARAADPEGRLPGEDFTAVQQLDTFAAMGFTAEEFIVLSGSHTLGSKGYGDPLTFDATYFPSLLDKPWTKQSDNSMAAMIGIPTDHVLPDDPTCRPIIEKYAHADQATFFRDFTTAYLKLSTLGW